MNRGDLERMRDRLAARAAADNQDSPMMVAAAGILWAFLCVVWAFL